MAHYQKDPSVVEVSPWHLASSGYSPVDQPWQEPQLSPPLSGRKAQYLHDRRRFKPLPHRTLPLAVLSVLVLALIGIVEWSMRILPQVPTHLGTHGINITLDKRQYVDDYGYSPPYEDSVIVTTSPPAAVTTFPTGVPPSSSFLHDKAETIILSPAPPPPPGSYHQGDATTTYAYVFKSYTQNSATTYIATVQDDPSGSDNPYSPNGPDNPDGVVAGATYSSYVKSVATTWINGSPVTRTDWGRPQATMTPGAPAPGDYNPNAAATLVKTGATAAYTALFPAVTGSDGQPEQVMQSTVPPTLIDKPQNYFLSVYMPVLVAVILRLLVSYLYRCTKLLDPFFALSCVRGAFFQDFFWSDHLGGESIWTPFYAIRSRRWLLLWTAVLYAITSLLTPLSSELMAIYQTDYTYKVPQGVALVRGSAVWVNPTIARIIQGCLGLIFVQLVSIWFLLRRQSHGLRSSPASIATIASIVGHPETANDISQFNQYAKRQMTTELFADRRYRLDCYASSSGDELYGIVPAESKFQQDFGSRLSGQSFAQPASLPSNSAFLAEYHGANMEESRSIFNESFYYLALMTAAAMALLGIVLSYAFNYSLTPFEHFMDSQSFGPRFLLSALGLIINSALLSLCALTTAALPFARLAERPRRAALDITTPVPLTPQGSITYALRRGEWFATGLALAGGVLIEALLILLPGVPFKAEQIWTAAQASWYGSIGCLGFILLVALAGWIRHFTKRSLHRWPKSPTSLGAVAMYTAGTCMSADFAGERTGASTSAKYDFTWVNSRWVVEIASERD